MHCIPFSKCGGLWTFVYTPYMHNMRWRPRFCTGWSDPDNSARSLVRIAIQHRSADPSIHLHKRAARVSVTPKTSPSSGLYFNHKSSFRFVKCTSVRSLICLIWNYFSFSAVSLQRRNKLNLKKNTNFTVVKVHDKARIHYFSRRAIIGRLCSLSDQSPEPVGELFAWNWKTSPHIQLFPVIGAIQVLRNAFSRGIWSPPTPSTL